VSELARRVAFAVAAIPVVVWVVWQGGWALAALLAVAAAIGAWEFYRIAASGGSGKPFVIAGVAASAAVPLLVHAAYAYPERVRVPISAVTIAILGLLAASIWLRGVDGRPLSAVASTVFGVLYTGVMLSFGYALRYYPYAIGAAAGAAVVGLPVLLTWASDTGAYFVGRALGKRKLIPSVSPGKTVAGAVGALVVTVLVCLVYSRYVLRPTAQLAFSPWGAAFFGLAISAVAQLGDLVESLLKREAGVKDSSHVIPGHGGVLDRFDSLLFVLPVAFPLLLWLLMPAPR
jgi:phosphatidate cytidylyltransferase